MVSSMARAWERVRTVPGLFRDVAVLILVVAVSIATLVVVNANLHGIFPWQHTSTVRAEFTAVPALDPAARPSVTIAGVPIGKVAGWEATRQGTAIVQLKLDPGSTTTIYQNARAVLRAKNPLNEMYIEVNPGGAPADPMPENGLIPISNTGTVVSADAALAHLDERARAAVTSLTLASDVALARAPEQLPDGLRAANHTIVDARPVMEALQTRRAKIADLVTALSQIAGAVGGNHDRAVQLAQSTQTTLGVLAQNDAKLKGTLDQLPGLNQELRNALSATQPLTAQLDPVLKDLDNASDELPKALDRFHDTIGKVDDVVDAAHPFLDHARPVVADLRPLVGNLDKALDDIQAVTRPLGDDVQTVQTYLDPLRAFIYNTSSVFGVRDGQGANVRGYFVAELPDDQFFPGGETRNVPRASDGMHPGNDRRATPPPPGDRVPNQQGPARGQNPLLPMMMGAPSKNGSN